MLLWGTKLEVDGDLGSETTFWGSRDGCKQMREQTSWPTEGRMKQPCREEQTSHTKRTPDGGQSLL